MRIKDFFAKQPKQILNLYFTAGYPALNSMKEIIEALNNTSVDLIEIGIPYSDPLSDGPTIQQSSATALENGISSQKIFDQLGSINTRIPIIIMAYFNSVYKFGVEAFCKECHDKGVSGIILPDLPMAVYLKDYKAIFDKYDLSNIFLITPETPEAKIKQIDQESSSFIYAVTSSSTTGNQKSLEAAEKYLDRLNKLNLSTPILAGFNIKDKEDFQFVTRHVAGAIIGSAFIRHLSKSKSLETDIPQFVNDIKEK